MTEPERGLLELARLLDRREIPYMVIGGLANAVWGQPRATLDIDVTIWAPLREVDSLMAYLEPAFVPVMDDPARFVAHTRVLPVRHRSGVRADLIFGGLAFEEEAIRRAREVLVQGVPVKFCTAEDLILHKVISDRERDQEDVRGILRLRLRELDFEYLEPRIQELADFLSRPEIRQRWETWKSEAGQV